MMKTYLYNNTREMLPLSSDHKRVVPRTPTRIVGRPRHGPLMLERLFISSIDGNGGLDWVINDLEVDGVSQLTVKDLSGVLFSTKGIAKRSTHASSALLFHGLDVIERESEVAVTVTYVGSNPLGMPFFASIVGDTPPQRPTVLPLSTTDRLLPTVTTTITAVLDRPLQIDMLEIEDAGTSGGAADWVVNDVRVDGASQFFQNGDVPGDMFATNAIDGFVKFQPGSQIELIVTYIGLDEEGCRFSARILGTVVRDDLEHAPPDVHAVVRTSGQRLAEEVVARCNWRVPYVQPGT